jgi:hypothetical protein
MAMSKLLEKDLKFEYLIPDLLPCPGTVMIHGAGGDGKSMSAWTIAKHVARGIPFSVRGDLVPVQKGPVLILNGDQSEVQVQQQLRDLEFRADDPVTVVMGWDLNWYFRFTKLIEKHRPKLVIIDSITGCSRGSAFDENKKEFASPIYWLANNNGRTFPACTILLIHHANKTGGFRGSTAIRDAVDEVWGLKRPDKKQLEQTGANARLITVEKSRAGRDGSKLLMKLENDLTFSLADYVELDTESASPASVVDRVLQRIRAAYPRSVSRSDLAADPLCGGSVAGIKKATQRLVSRGLICVSGQTDGNNGAPATPLFQAISSREKPLNVCPGKVDPLVRLESDPGQGVEGVPAPLDDPSTGTTPRDTDLGCPGKEASHTKGSGSVGQLLDVSPREERSSEEIQRLQADASAFWD